jgi:hypothetical protein
MRATNDPGANRQADEKKDAGLEPAGRLGYLTGRGGLPVELYQTGHPQPSLMLDAAAALDDLKSPPGRGVTADTALRLARAFSTTPDFWLNLQKTYELRTAEENTETSQALRRIRRLVPT